MKSTSQSAVYRRVPILRPGAYADSRGRPVSFSAVELTRIAEDYDPRYHSAPVNIDHHEHGPALGAVSDLVFDGEHLCADLVNVPGEVADAIDAGRYPFRSAEIYADLDGRGPYLRALALLGARPPAVKGLPPFPARQSAVGETQAPVAARGGINTYLKRSPRPGPRSIHIITEAHMPKTKKDQPAAAPEPPQDAVSDAVRLAEENHRLAEEIRQLKAAERQRSVSWFLAELRDSGRLTPAMEQAGLEPALIACDEQQLMVAYPDGRQVALGEVLRDVLRALPASVSFEPALAEDQPATAELSDQEREIAAQLGLSEQEFAEIKAG